MTNQIQQISPKVYARVGGALYLIMIILGIVNELVIRGKVVVQGNAAATAANLRSMESLWRTGIAIELLMAMITICLAIITYLLTKPVNRIIALLALSFNLIAIGVGASYALQLAEALFPVGGGEYLKAFTPEQLYAIANMSVKSHSIGFGIDLLLFGPFFFCTGYLIIKSGYIPKYIGILYLIPGFSYTISSFALIIAPQFADKYYFVIAGPALLGELSLCLWFLIKGVIIREWNKKQFGGENLSHYPAPGHPVK